MTKFAHRRLEADEIRLVTLLPNSSPSSIQCTISHHRIEEFPNYDAISYCWGDQSRLQKIVLDGVDFSITESLWQALLHLRSTTERRILWVDAICINQDDLMERNHQVKRMFDIYRNAHTVRSWVGYGEDESDDALRKVIQDRLQSSFGHDKFYQRSNLRPGQQVNRAWNMQNLLCPLDEFSTPTVVGRGHDPNVPLDQLLSAIKASFDQPSGWRTWVDLATIICKPYWTRIWVQQEISRQTGVTVHYGHLQFPLMSLFRVREAFFQYVNKLGSGISEGPGNPYTYIRQ